MKRRDFVILVGSAGVAWPLATRAQQTERVRLALMPFDAQDEEGRAFIAMLRQTLQKSGWVDGR